MAFQEALQRTAGARRFARWPRSLCRHLIRAFPSLAGDLVQDEGGAALFEMAPMLLAVMVFVMTVMELCLVFYTYGVMSESAREGTRYAAMHGSSCQTAAGASCTASAATIQSYVTGLGYPNVGGGTMHAVATFPQGNQTPGSTVTVTITYTFPIKLPFVPRNSISLTSISTMYIIQ
jgi:Flp pilus assembly protein TadG